MVAKSPCLGISLPLPGLEEPLVLSDGQYAAALTVSLLVGYAALRGWTERRLAGHPKRLNARSWLLTLLVSPWMFACSVPALAEARRRGWSEEWGYDESSVSRACVMGFVIYMVVDLAVGVVDYRKEIDPLSGWFHHIAYCAMLGYVCLKHQTKGFMPWLLEEASTVVLGLGRAQIYRNDWLTGASFFAVRVVFHAYMQYVWWVAFVAPGSQHFAWYYYLCTPAGLLNCKWMLDWCRGQQKRMRKAAAAKRR